MIITIYTYHLVFSLLNYLFSYYNCLNVHLYYNYIPFFNNNNNNYNYNNKSDKVTIENLTLKRHFLPCMAVQVSLHLQYLSSLAL